MECSSFFFHIKSPTARHRFLLLRLRPSRAGGKRARLIIQLQKPTSCTALESQSHSLPLMITMLYYNEPRKPAIKPTDVITAPANIN